MLADEYVRVRADTSYIAKDIKKHGSQAGRTSARACWVGSKPFAGRWRSSALGRFLGCLEGRCEAPPI